MERHTVPINFRDIKIEDFIRHMDYRLEVENATPHAMAHEKKVLIMFLRAYGILDNPREVRQWSSICKTPPIISSNQDIDFVYPQDVNKFFTYEGYSNLKDKDKCTYENRLFQHLTFMGFMFGMRFPSEIVNLTVNDVVIKKDGKGYILVHEQKKRGVTRKIMPHNENILSSPAFKTPKNYLEHWRPKVANDKSGDALFLQPNGKPITEAYSRRHVKKAGDDIVGKSFKCYHMRHTYATFLYQDTQSILKVSRRLGHTKVANTQKYVACAEDLEEQYKGRKLFNIALRPLSFKDLGGQQIVKQLMGQAENRQRPNEIPPRERNGLSRI